MTQALFEKLGFIQERYVGEKWAYTITAHFCNSNRKQANYKAWRGVTALCNICNSNNLSQANYGGMTNG